MNLTNLQTLQMLFMYMINSFDPKIELNKLFSNFQITFYLIMCNTAHTIEIPFYANSSFQCANDLPVKDMLPTSTE